MVVIRRELPLTYRVGPGRSPVAKRGRGSSFPRAARTLAALLQHVLLYAARTGREASCLSTSTPTAQTKPASSRATAVIACCLVLPRPMSLA